MSKAQPAPKVEVMPVDTRTPEQRDEDSKKGITWQGDFMFNNFPVEIPSHYECHEGYGFVVTHDVATAAFSCKPLGPERSDARGRGWR